MTQAFLYAVNLIVVILCFSVPTLAAKKSTDDLDCVIEPYMTVELSSPVQGVLEEVLVKRGDSVKKGQVLARLKSGVEQSGVILAKTRAESITEIKVNTERYELSKRSLKRVEELYQKKLISPNEHDEAFTSVVVGELEVLLAKESHHVAQLELNRAEEILKLRSIVSPIDGVVVERYKSPGEFVEDQPLLKLVQVNPLNVEVIAPLHWLGTIKNGMVVRVFPEKPIGGSYKAKVVIVDPVVDSASGTFGIRLELPNDNHKVSAGLTCDVKFPGKRRK
jgi:RND family efflux transporter MFP subunit